MERQELKFGELTAIVLWPENCQVSNVIYLPGSDTNEAEELMKAIEPSDTALVALGNLSWNDDMTPWPARRAFKGEEDFSGGADSFLERLVGQIIPEVELLLPAPPLRRGVVGYSLGGLFAIYALYRTNLFELAASVSGSLWYDGFIDLLRERPPEKLPQRVYFSLGDRESHTRNARVAAVEECTAQAAELLAKYGAETVFRLNPGNHFVDSTARMLDGLRWLLDC